MKRVDATEIRTNIHISFHPTLLGIFLPWSRTGNSGSYFRVPGLKRIGRLIFVPVHKICTVFYTLKTLRTMRSIELHSGSVRSYSS